MSNPYSWQLLQPKFTFGLAAQLLFSHPDHGDFYFKKVFHLADNYHHGAYFDELRNMHLAILASLTEKQMSAYIQSIKEEYATAQTATQEPEGHA